ncbi:hypothetical protein TNCV_2371421 [Trichonephila clavipes]|nr:hypothetical protein TNCV_2371421 [Trichonephila clavipes]
MVLWGSRQIRHLPSVQNKVQREPSYHITCFQSSDAQCLLVSCHHCKRIFAFYAKMSGLLTGNCVTTHFYPLQFSTHGSSGNLLGRVLVDDLLQSQSSSKRTSFTSSISKLSSVVSNRHEMLSTYFSSFSESWRRPFLHLKIGRLPKYGERHQPCALDMFKVDLKAWQ